MDKINASVADYRKAHQDFQRAQNVVEVADFAAGKAKRIDVLRAEAAMRNAADRYYEAVRDFRDFLHKPIE